jgi:hypothetical protein
MDKSFSDDPRSLSEREQRPYRTLSATEIPLFIAAAEA